MSREGLVGKVLVEGHLEYGSHKMIVFHSQRSKKWEEAELLPCAFGGQTWACLGDQLTVLSWGAVLKGRGVPEVWTFLKKEILKV